MADIKYLLREYRKKNKLTLDEISGTTGISKSLLSRYEKGTISKPNLENLQRLSELLNIELDMPETERNRLTPYYDVVATASNNSVEVISDVGNRSFINLGETLPKAEVVIRVSGNSMTPNYPSGCLIGLRVISDGLFDYGSVYVIETPDNRFLKRIYKGKNDAHIQCYSDNNQLFTDGVRQGQPWYESFQLPLSKIKRVFKVVGCIKHNDHSHIPEF